MLDKLERSKLARWAIPNLTLYLVVGQAVAWLIGKSQPSFISGLVLLPAKVLQGEVWRLVSFMFLPPPSNMFGDFGVLISLVMLFVFGRALEGQWGSFRFNAFLFVGWLLTAAVSFVTPYGVATNFFLMESIFLAFAYLNPNFELLLAFVLPVKVKWLGLLAGAHLAYTAVTAAMAGMWSVTALIAAGVANLFIFFGPDMWLRARGAGRRTAKRSERARDERTPNHTCSVCGLTDLQDSEMRFRYCSKCTGGRAYCSDHLKVHEHIV